MMRDVSRGLSNNTSDDVSDEAERTDPLIRVAVAGPSLLCRALSKLVADFDGVRSIVTYDEGIGAFQADQEAAEADAWLLLSGDQHHLSRLLRDSRLPPALAGNSMEHRTLLVASAFLVALSNHSNLPSEITSLESAQLQNERERLEWLLRAAGSAGITAFVSINDPPEVLEEGLFAASSGEPFCSVALTPWLIRAFQPVSHDLSIQGGRAGIALLPQQDRQSSILARSWNLTRLETAVAAQAAQGLSNEAIARQLFLSVNTVKTHLKEVFRKGGLTCRSQLAAQWTAAQQQERQ